MNLHSAGRGLSILDCPDTEWVVDPLAGVMTHPSRTPWTSRAGYLYFDERANGCRRKGLVHRAVWEFAHGRIQQGRVINHINGDKTDNRLTNLEVVTHRENNRHARETGLSRNIGGAGRAHRAKRTGYTPRVLNAEIVLLARSRVRQGYSIGAVAKELSVNASTLAKAVMGASWAHLPGAVNG